MRYAFGGFILDVARRHLTREGENLGLAPKEFLTLRVLVEGAGRSIARDVLTEAIWPDAAVGDTSLARNISALRRHLGKDAIVNVPKFGYRFELPVTVVEEAAQPELLAGAISSVSQLPTRAGVPWRRGWLVAAGIVLTAVLSAGALGSLSGAAGREAGDVWSDPQTHLAWTRADNGRDVSRLAAIGYCSSLTLAHERGWRLPTIEELQTLHDPAAAHAGVWGLSRPVYWHVKGNLHLTGGETASDTTFLTDLTPAGEEQSYDFSYERRNYDPEGFSADHRALCVRGW